MNKILKCALVLVNVLLVALTYVNSNYLKSNMAYYRTMFRFDRDFDERSTLFFITVSILIVVISLILIKFNKLKIRFAVLFILLQTLIITYYMIIESYLSISVDVLITSLITFISFLLMCLIKRDKNKYISIVVSYILVLLILFI